MGGAGNSGQEPGSQVAVSGGGNAPLPGWGSSDVPGSGSGTNTGVPGADTGLVRSPYEDITASTGSGPATGLLAGNPMGQSSTSLLTYAGQGNATGFNQTTPYPDAPTNKGAPTGTPDKNDPNWKDPTTIVAAPPQPIPEPTPAPLPPPPPADPWAGRVQIFGPGAEGFASDTSAQWLARWPSQAQAQQKPGTDNWYLPVGVSR